MILTNDDTSPLSGPPEPSSPSSVIGSNGLLDPRQEAKFKTVDIPQRRRLPGSEIQRAFPPPSENCKNLRRVRSDNLAQSKREDPSVRRSIFGHYFKEKPRSYSAPHLERGQPPPPIPIHQQQPNPKEEQQLQQTTRRSYKRSSWSPSISPLPPVPPTPERNANQIPDHYGSRRHHIHDHPSNQVLAVDYRVFAPSEQQVAESAICNRYRELNREHQKDYDSLLERQVQVEHSLPPFPSPLVRFCSDTTTLVAEHDASSSQKNHPESRRYFSSPDGEMHYHGVYSLLKPCSILRPSRYSTNKRTTPTIASDVSNVPSTLTINSANNMTKQSEREDMNDHLSAPLSSSFNFPRSYIETSAILNHFSSSTLDPQSIANIGGEEEEEEKKENDHTFASASSAPDILLLPSKVINDSSISNTNITGIVANDGYHNESKDRSEDLEGLPQNKRRFRFDPRVTVTEFEDPVPRKWYHDSELEMHKREAIALAQCYLRNHPAVAEWYRRAILDPITKTYRKRALFSLPVFSSTYTGIDAVDMSPEMTAHKNDVDNLEEGITKTFRGISSPAPRKGKSLTPKVKKILVVHPNPKIVSLFCKSMKSMFPSAQLVSTGSAEDALRLIEESFAPSTNNGSPLSSLSSTSATARFDIMIVEQHLTYQVTSSPPEASKLKGVFKNPLGFWETCIGMNKDDDDDDEEKEESPPSSPTNNFIRRGSDLIHLVHELSLCHHPNLSSLLIGVSVRPERDAPLMERAGADIVWGIPIPKVGEALRNKLFSVLLAKRSSGLSSGPSSPPRLK